MAEEVEQAEIGHAETPTWLIWAQGITAVLTFVGTFWLAYEGKAAAPFAGAGVALLLLFRFGDIASLTLEGFGGRADMKRATRRVNRVTKEAEKTIEALKQIGMSLSDMTLTMQAITDSSGSLTLRNIVQGREEIIAHLKAIDCSPDELKRVLAAPNHALLIRMTNRANRAMRADHQALIVPEMQRLFRDMPVDMSEVRAVFERYEITSNAEIYLGEAENFQDTGEIDLERLGL